MESCVLLPTRTGGLSPSEHGVWLDFIEQEGDISTMATASRKKSFSLAYAAGLSSGRR